MIHKRISEKTWQSSNKNYEIKVWLDKGGIGGELYDRVQGKIYPLNEALQMDRDYPYFPSEVSENLNRLVGEIKR